MNNIQDRESLTRGQFFDRYDRGHAEVDEKGIKIFTISSIDRACFLRWFLGPDCSMTVKWNPHYRLCLVSFADPTDQCAELVRQFNDGCHVECDPRDLINATREVTRLMAVIRRDAN